MLPTLARRHRVYAVDQRGHGGTEAPACCYALADLAYDAVAFLDAMKVQRAAVVGHSLGSFVGPAPRLRLPAARDAKLVLMGSSDAPSGSDAVAWLWEQGADVRRPRSAPRSSRSGSRIRRRWRPSFLAKVKAETAAVPPHVWKGVARTLLTEDQRRFLPDLRAPVLILAGEKDADVPAGRPGASPQGRCRTRVLKVYPQVGHNFHWEIPKPVGEELAAFLATPFQSSSAAVPQRGHVDHEAVADVLLQQALVGFVDLLDRDRLDVGDDAVLGAEVEHLLRLADAADRGAGEVAARQDQLERRDRQRLLGRADQAQRPVQLEQRQAVR